MKLRFNRLFGRMLSNKGYTIDQTILIVAIIAILITLVIITVGWTLINRTSGTKVGAQLKQVEDANGQFYSQWKVWPQDAYTAPAPTAALNVAALTGQGNGVTTWATNITAADTRNYLSGFKVSGGVVSHSIGNGGTISMQLGNYPVAAGIGTDNRMVVQFANVPVAEAEEADKSIDGSATPAAGYNVGRVIYQAAACLPAAPGAVTLPTVRPTTGVVNVCYAANSI